MPALDPVRVIVVGAGNFGRMHARTIAGLAEAQLVGVVEPDPRAIELLRQSVPDIKSWSGLDEALAQRNAEGFVVATRTALHLPIAEQILRAGFKVLVEKPLSSDAATAERLAPLIAEHSANFMSGHVVLFAPKFRRLARECRQRTPIKYFHAVRHRPVTTADLYPEENPFRLTMVHDLYLALALTDGAEPVRLSGRLRPRADRGFDLALADVCWPNGIWGSFAASFLTPRGMPADGFDRWEIFGGGWAARLSLNPQPLELWSDSAEWPIGLDIDDNPAAPSGWLAEELRQFCRVVRGLSPVPLGARYQDALRVQSWIEQLERSAKETI
jgi:predicted dehydrogenase